MSDNNYKKNGVDKYPGNVLVVTGITGLGYNIAPQVGIYQIMNYLNYKNINCDIYDRDLEFYKKTNFNKKEVLENIRKGEYDVIGISVSHSKANDENGKTVQKMCIDLDLIWEMRQTAKESGKMPVFVAGGQAATLNYKQWLDYGIDLIVLGYGEKTFYDICKEYFSIPRETREVSKLIEKIDGVRGVSFKEKSGIYRYTPTLHVTKELFKELFFELPQKMPIPYQKFWDILKENSATQDLGAAEFIYENVRVYTTSHCPRMCGFCNSGQYLKETTAEEKDLMINRNDMGIRFSKGVQKLVRLDAQEVMDLIMFYIKNYGAKSFLFSDDDFALKGSDNRTEKFADLVIEYKEKGIIDKNISFHCQTHVTDWLLPDQSPNIKLLKKIKKAGFKSISMGVETFTDGVITSKSINKQGYRSKHSQAVLNAMLECGISPQTNVILGVPEYTPEELLKTVDVALEYVTKGCDIAISRQLMALPGAPIYESGLYKVKYDHFKHPVTNEDFSIPDYFIPNHPVVAKAMEVYDEELRKVLDKLDKKMNWKGKNAPKRVVQIAGLTCLPELLGKPELAPKYNKILDDVLSGKCKGGDGFAFADV